MEPNPKQSQANEAGRGPSLCVDVIIDMGAGMILMIERKNEPSGWALPGGFVDQGETIEEAALREVREETGLDVELVRQFHCYSNPKRDLRQHTVSVVFVARGWGKAKAGDDAAKCELYHEMNLPANIAFDHRDIIRDYYQGRY